jgi:hypothetical protein
MRKINVVQKWFPKISSVPRNFFGREGGSNKFSSGQRAERRGIWGSSPLDRGFTEFVIERNPYSG